jgi:hypothetical protein
MWFISTGLAGKKINGSLMKNNLSVEWMGCHGSINKVKAQFSFPRPA